MLKSIFIYYNFNHIIQIFIMYILQTKNTIKLIQF